MTEEESNQGNQLPNPYHLKEGVVPPMPASLPARYGAFFLDYLLLVAAFYLITTQFIYPVFHPEFSRALQEFWEHQQTLTENTGFREMLQIQMEFHLEHERAIADTQFVFIVMTWIYFAMSELLMQGSTLGKKVFKLQTIDLRTMLPATGKSLLVRNCLKTISVTIIFPILLIINLIIPFFSRFRLTGHDVIAKTMVTYESFRETN